MKKYAFGVDIGGTTCKMGLRIDRRGITRYHKIIMRDA